MSCRKKCGSCDKCKLFEVEAKGPRGFRGPTGSQGNVGPTGPCCTGPTGPAASIVPTFFPTFKPLAATFYGVGPGTVGPGDVFDFPLDGPNDPIGRADSGTFVLPFAGLYKVSWQMPIVEGVIPFGSTDVPTHVQSILTAQTVAEGAFAPVAGGTVGKGSSLSQLVGETIVDATRNDFPIRIENSSRGFTGPTGLPGPFVPVNYYSPIPDSPNHRTINIASLVPQRTYAIGLLINSVPEVVAPGADVTFNQTGGSDSAGNPIGPATNTNVGVTPTTAPFTGLVIEIAGQYVVEWFTALASNFGTLPFYPYVNGMPLPAFGQQGGETPFISGSGRVLSSITLQVGDVVTLRNQIGAAIPLRNDVPFNAYLAIYRVGP